MVTGPRTVDAGEVRGRTAANLIAGERPDGRTPDLICTPPGGGGGGGEVVRIYMPLTWRCPAVMNGIVIFR